jgi:hypothetical protein
MPNGFSISQVAKVSARERNASVLGRPFSFGSTAAQMRSPLMSNHANSARYAARLIGCSACGRSTGDVRLVPALDRPKTGSIGICTNPSGMSQKNARQVTQLRRRHGHAAAGVGLDRNNILERRGPILIKSV